MRSSISSSEAGERDKGLALWTVAVAEGARKVRVLLGIVGRVRAFVRAFVCWCVRNVECLSVWVSERVYSGRGRSWSCSRGWVWVDGEVRKGKA